MSYFTNAGFRVIFFEFGTSPDYNAYGGNGQSAHGYMCPDDSPVSLA